MTIDFDKDIYIHPSTTDTKTAVQSISIESNYKFFLYKNALYSADTGLCTGWFYENGRWKFYSWQNISGVKIEQK